LGTQLFINRRNRDPRAELVSHKHYPDITNKPKGAGIFTSIYRPHEGLSDWVCWCLGEQPNWVVGNRCFLLTPLEGLRIYVIDGWKDLEWLQREYPSKPRLEMNESMIHKTTDGIEWPDFERDFDACHLTRCGSAVTHYDRRPKTLERGLMSLGSNSWDCESTWWARWSFSKVEFLRTITKADEFNCPDR
jgi:hypothetical protein